MDRKALLAFLGLGALAFALGGCSDAGGEAGPLARGD